MVATITLKIPDEIYNFTLWNFQSPGKYGKPGSPISLEWGVEATRAVLTASNITSHDAGH